ncbi:MAG: rRNA maturation RNase YbeY [Candidatus Eremiobacteraeota bacterium]|nr:rRNA maturation RNase YbeY [Candidatus Eremiobacteraeota bacterium]
MIYFRNATRGSGIDSRGLKTTAKLLLDAAGESESTLSLTLVDDRKIQNLNRLHRGKDCPTDVLSFPLEPDEKNGGERMLGDVVISVDTARRQAKDYAAPLERELQRLLIHGVLHVLGHDHEEPVESRRMRAEERRLARTIGMPWPYDDDGE